MRKYLSKACKILRCGTGARAGIRNGGTQGTAHCAARAILYAAAGLGAGFLNGLLGAAGGILLVAVLPVLPPLSNADAPSQDRRGAQPSLSNTDASPQTRQDALPILSNAEAPYQDRRDVLATSMAVMLPVSAVSLVLYFLRGLQPPTALLSAIWLPSLVGGVIGAWLLDRLPVRTVKILFALLVLVSGVRMVFG